MPNLKRFNPLAGWMLLGLLASSGCADGPFFAIRKLNPMLRNQQQKDRQLGPTFDDRRAEVKLLQRQIGGMSSEEQAKWLQDIEKLVANDPSPDMRRDAILALQSVPDSGSIRVLQKAAGDDSEKVRMAVCDVLAQRKEPEAIALLGKLAQSDESSSVRISAIEGIGSFPSEQAKPLLAKTLQDHSPAIQYQTTLALQKSTGKPLGADVSLWKKYLNGEEVEPSEVSLAESLGSLIGIKR